MLNEIPYNFTIPGTALSVDSTAELLPDSQEGKEVKIKAKLSTLIGVSDLKSNESEQQGAVSTGSRLPHAADSCQPVPVPAVVSVSLSGPRQRTGLSMTTGGAPSPAEVSGNPTARSRAGSKASCSLTPKQDFPFPEHFLAPLALE